MKTAKEMLEFLILIMCGYLAGSIISFIAALITVIFSQK